MKDGNEDLRELLATARAIHFAYQQGAITLQQAKDRTKPLLLSINKAVTLIAKEFKVKPKYISFGDLGKNI
jgi:hypothetical protein